MVPLWLNVALAIYIWGWYTTETSAWCVNVATRVTRQHCVGVLCIIMTPKPRASCCLKCLRVGWLIMVSMDRLPRAEWNSLLHTNMNRNAFGELKQGWGYFRQTINHCKGIWAYTMGGRTSFWRYISDDRWISPMTSSGVFELGNYSLCKCFIMINLYLSCTPGISIVSW